MAVLNRALAAPQQRVSVAVRFGPLLLIAVAALVIVGLLRVVQTSQATTAGFAVQALQQDKLELETSVRQLEAEVAALSSLARVELEAARLGLLPPAQESSVQVNVAPPSAGLLPSRFAPPQAEAQVATTSRSWWRNLLNILTFN